MINLKQELLNRQGKVSKAKIPVIEQVEKDGQIIEEQRLEERVVTLGSMLEHACLKDNGNRLEESVVQRFELFQKLKDKDEVELSKEDIEYLRVLVCESYDVFFAGTILEILK